MRKVKRNGLHPEVRKYYLLGIASIFIIMVLGVGYAILTQNLNISGTANISSSWDILFTTVTEGTLKDSKTISKNITGGTSLTLNVELNQPGASATYNVTVSNRGNLDASLASIADVEEGNKANPTAIKYRVEGISVGDSLLANTEQTFQVVVTWDKSVDISSDHMEKEIKVTLNYEQKTGTPTPTSTPDANTAAVLLASKNTVGNSEGLFTDDYGNIRYRGSNSEVKNYVTFNGETWRIIGVFDGKVKLIRNESLGDMQWNETTNNNWDTSSLKTYLNGEYYNSLSSTTKNQIETSTFYLGGHNTSEGMYARTIYEKERGTTVYTGNPTTTNQNIGLMYPSDYGYAARSSCSKDLYNYETDINCSKEGNWLYITSREQWLQTPHSGNASIAFSVYYDGYVFTGAGVLYGNGVRPVIYLKSNIGMTGGEGTSASPYMIG